MVRKIDDFGAYVADIVLVLDVIDLLLVVHEEERLRHKILQIVLNVFFVGLESHKPAPGQLVDLLNDSVIIFARMKLYLLNLLVVFLAFCEEYCLIVAADQMVPEHGLRLAYDFKHTFVQGELHDAVIELQDHYVHLIAANLLRNQLRALDLVIVEASKVIETISLFFIDDIDRYLIKLAAEQEQRVFDDIWVCLTVRIVQPEPRVRLERHQSNLLIVTNKEHDVTVCLLVLLEKLLLDHLRMVHEADELPLAQV